MIKPAITYAALGLIITGFSDGEAMAICVPPYKTMFACDIYKSERRVEICQETPAEEGGVPDHYSYNFASGAEMSELYFVTDDVRFSTKFYDPDRQDGENTLGVGLVRRNYIYTFYITGLYESHVKAAQIHVFDSLTAYES